MHWDRETYPYVVAVSWTETGGPLITVLRRLQQHGLVLAVDPRTGETQVHAELADPRWVEPIAGTPMYLPDGRVLVGGELAHDGYDARCLFADGTLVSPPSLYVRRVCGRLGHRPAGRGDRGRAERAAPVPARRGRRRVSGRGDPADHGSPAGTPALVGGDTLVVASMSLDLAGYPVDGLARPAVAGRRAGQPGRDPAVRAPAGAGAGHRPAAARRRCSTRAATSPGASCRCWSTSTAGPGHQEVVAARSPLAGAAVVGRRRVRRGHHRQPGYARASRRASRR